MEGRKSKLTSKDSNPLVAKSYQAGSELRDNLVTCKQRKSFLIPICIVYQIKAKKTTKGRVNLGNAVIKQLEFDIIRSYK